MPSALEKQIQDMRDKELCEITRTLSVMNEKLANIQTCQAVQSERFNTQDAKFDNVALQIKNANLEIDRLDKENISNGKKIDGQTNRIIAGLAAGILAIIGFFFDYITRK